MSLEKPKVKSRVLRTVYASSATRLKIRIVLQNTLCSLISAKILLTTFKKLLEADFRVKQTTNSVRRAAHLFRGEELQVPGLSYLMAALLKAQWQVITPICFDP